MQRTEYFNHTRPTQRQLNYTEDSKIASILRRFRSTCQMGIRTGFVVSINSGDATLIDVGPGEGYGGGFYSSENIRGNFSGERISTITDSATGQPGYQTTASGQSLADYTAGTKNYVFLQYIETETEPLSERYYPFDSHNTIVSESFRVSVLTEAQWNALSSDQLDLRILIAIVTANGAGIALTASSIQQVVQPKTHPTAANPSTITGTTVASLSQETLIGSATLRYEAATKRMYWTSPGDAEGTGVQISSSGTYTLYSNNTTYWIRVEVVFSALPAADTSETIAITSLYGRTIPMSSAIDQAHRDMLGSGQPTVNNPHALTLNDIEGGTFDHADYFHVNGISKDSVSTMLECSIDVANDAILINNPGGANDRCLIDGLTYNTITGASAGTDGQVSFDVVPAPDTGRYLIYLDSAGNPQRLFCGGDLWVAGTILRIVDMYNKTAGNGTITWDNSDDSLTWQAPGDGAAGSKVYLMDDLAGLVGHEGYYKLYSSDTENWIIVYAPGTAIGASNNSTISLDMNSTDHPADEFLRLAMVHWDSVTETLSLLDDLRRFVTADNRTEFEEEHDEDGLHNKVMQHSVRAIASNGAFYGSAFVTVGVRGEAANYGMYGVAQTDTGVYGTATQDYGMYASAARSFGAYGRAATIGVAGRGIAVTGVYGTAPTLAGVYLANNTGISASVVQDTAVWGTARSWGVYGKVAEDYGGVFSAGDDYGISVTADDDFAGLFSAGGDYGISAYAGGQRAAFFRAAVDTGVYARAANEAGIFVADTAVAVYGYGLNTAGMFSASHSVDATVYGVMATATNASAAKWAVAGYFTASANAAATAVYANAPPTGGMGIYATGSSIGAFVKGVTGVHIDGLIRYAPPDTEGTNAYTFAVPLVYGGNTYCLAVYSTV